MLPASRDGGGDGGGIGGGSLRQLAVMTSSTYPPVWLGRTVVALLLLLALGAIGLELGWFGSGLSESEAEALEASWSWVEETGAEVEPLPEDYEPLRELLLTWDGESPDGLEGRVEELVGLLERRPGTTLVGVDRVVNLVRVVDAAAETLEGAELLALARFGGRVRSSGNLVQFAVGNHILRAVLKRCEAEPELTTSLDELESPRTEELFEAVCRDALHSPATDEDWTLANFPMLESDPELAILETRVGEPGNNSPLATFMRDGARLAWIDMLRRLEPLASDPSSWASVTVPETPDGLSTWLGMKVQDPRVLAATMAPLLLPPLESLAANWVETLELWEKVVGEGSGR